jgi:hypothetical protein
MIILEGIDVCLIAWYKIMGISKATYYRWKENAGKGMRAKHHRNLGTKKPCTHTLQAITSLQLMLEQLVDHIPHKMRMLENGEKVVSKCLPSSKQWKDTLLELNIVNGQFGLRHVSPTGLNRI